MIELESWLKAYADRMEAAFGERLVLLGLQGSYRRGEATEESDIDLVARAEPGGRGGTAAVPGAGAGAAGGGKGLRLHRGAGRAAELAPVGSLPAGRDVRVLRGRAEAVFPAFTAADARQAAREGAAALYHAACHSFLYGEASGGALAELYKGAFFVLRAAHDARAGYRAVSRRDLLPRLEGDDREILAACIGRKAFLDAGSGGAGRGISGAYPLVRKNPQRVRRGRCIRVKKGVYWQVELHGFLDF